MQEPKKSDNQDKIEGNENCLVLIIAVVVAIKEGFSSQSNAFLCFFPRENERKSGRLNLFGISLR